MLVVSASAAVRQKARLPIALGPKSVFRAVVIEPRKVASLVSAKQVRQAPERAVLAAVLARAGTLRQASASVILEGLWTSRRLDHEARILYGDLILARLSPAILEQVMQQLPPAFTSAFAQKWIKIGEEKGIEKGRREGIEKGRREGLETGLRALRHAIVVLARDRNLRVGARTLAKLEEVSDAEQLERWLRAVPTARTMREVLATK
ncbi:MAG: hypothetical protein HYV07_03100 [Deltaproteobacteria bacterium]|nr:hypothetical protein [Deltaproteobacteria bacterium]